MTGAHVAEIKRDNFKLSNLGTYAHDEANDFKIHYIFYIILIAIKGNRI